MSARWHLDSRLATCTCDASIANCDCESECLQLQFNIPSPGFEPSPGSLPTTRWSPPNSCVLSLSDTGYLLDTARLARDRRWHTTIQQRQLRQTHIELVLSFSHFESRVLLSFSPSLLLRVISDPRSCSLCLSLPLSLYLLSLVAYVSLSPSLSIWSLYLFHFLSISAV